VFEVNVSPLIPAGMGLQSFFDPTVMWQIKIAHGANSPEDQVIQFGVNGTGTSQTVRCMARRIRTKSAPRTPSWHRPHRSPTTPPPSSRAESSLRGPARRSVLHRSVRAVLVPGRPQLATHSSQTDPGPETAGPLFNGDSVGPPGAFAPAFDKSANPPSRPSTASRPARPPAPVPRSATTPAAPILR